VEARTGDPEETEPQSKCVRMGVRKAKTIWSFEWSQAGCRNNHKPTENAKSIFTFVTLPARGSLKQHPDRGTQVGMQAPWNSVHAG